MQRFPTLLKLARARRSSVLKQWEGLGYYRRAHHLHATAQYLATHASGVFPSRYDVLLELPGVGPYTAAAVASLAFNKNHAVVDGNVVRVLSRWLAYNGNIKSTSSRSELAQWAQRLLVKGHATEYNEAIMELGALVCTPQRPRCEICPMQRVCRAYLSGDPEKYPNKPRRKKVPHKTVGAAVILREDGRVLIARRRDQSMLGGLWEFPGGSREKGETIAECIRREIQEELGIHVAVGHRLVKAHHAYSHFTIELHAHLCRIITGVPRAIECAGIAWASSSELKRYAFSRADHHILQALTIYRSKAGTSP